MYRVTVRNPKKLEKEIRKYPESIINKIASTMKLLEYFPDINHLKKLSNNKYRIRINDYRLLFSVDLDQNTIIIHNVLHRREAYR